MTDETPVPSGQLRAELERGAITQDRPIIGICRSGNRSGKAADTPAAAEVGMPNLAGGVSACAEAGLPVVTHDGKPGTVA